MNLLIAPDRVVSETAAPPRAARSTDALLIAALATLISGIAAGRPSLWFDEAATISAAANRSLPELWRLLGHIDAVHGLYYLLMHGWFAVFPATEFWSRLPSCLAAGVGAAGVVTLTRRLAPRRVAVCAGVLFAILPRTTWAGIEARPYAFAAAAAVWLTVLCLTAVRRDTAPIWLGYGVAVVFAVLLNTFTVLLVPVHAVLIRVLGADRSATRRWVCTAGAALAFLARFLVFSQTQIRQVGWIHPLNAASVLEVAQQQYFDKSALFAALAWAVIVTTAVACRTGRRRLPSGRSRQLLIVCTAWMLLPTLVVLAYSALAKPIYYPRYLICTAPAMAIVLAVCVTTLTGKPWGVRATAALLALFTLAALPNYAAQRGRNAKEGWDYSQVADVIKAQALPGDCLLIDNTTRWAPGPIRALLAARPDAFAGLTDPGRGPHGPDLGRLWDGHIGVWATAGELSRCTTIWTITDHDWALPAYQAGAALPAGKRFSRTPDGQLLRWLGFRTVERWQFTFAQVIRSAR